MATLNEPTFQTSRPFRQSNPPNFNVGNTTVPSMTNRPDATTTTTTTTTITTKVSKPKSSITVFDIIKMMLIGGLAIGWTYMVYRFIDEKSAAIQDYVYFVDVKDLLFQLIVVLMLIFIWVAVRFKSTPPPPPPPPAPDQCSLKNKQKIAEAQKKLYEINKLTTSLTAVLNDGNCNVEPAPVSMSRRYIPPQRTMPAPPVPEPIKKAEPSCRPRMP